MSYMDKSKPCPFCGEVPELEFTGRYYQVCCSNAFCDIRPSTDYYKNEQNAIEAWNTRKGENQIENNIRAVAEVLGLNKGEEKRNTGNGELIKGVETI